MRLSSARLAALFVVIFAAAITLVLTAVYVLTARVLDREVDSVIRSEVTHLVDDYSTRRPAAAGRDPASPRRQLGPHRRGLSADRAERLSRSPATSRTGRYDFDTYGNWIEFEIDASEAGGVVSHPVRAQVFLLARRSPAARRHRHSRTPQLASRLRTAMFWGAGSSVLLATVFGLELQPAHPSPRPRVREHLRVDHGRRPVAAPAGGKVARRVRRARHGRQSHARDASSSRPTCCARRSTAPRTTCAVRCIARACASKSRCSTKA